MLRVDNGNKIYLPLQEIVELPHHFLPSCQVDVGIAAEVEFFIVVALLEAGRVDRVDGDVPDRVEILMLLFLVFLGILLVLLELKH